MRNLMYGLALLALTAPAFAQSSSDAPRATTTPPAVSNPSDANKTTAAPVAGKNSFTQEQAMKRLQDHGYSNVMGLTKDAQSIWHGKANKDGKPVTVAVDYQGNITAE
jgi:hypothetical protein